MKVIGISFGLFLLAGLLALPPQAQATLGEGSDSVARDRHALSATPHATTTHPKYTVQEVASEATTVREYLNSSGVVFAVAWDGLVHPDLTTLMGSYASEYRDAKRQVQRKHGQRQLRVKANRVIVETWGHMRNLQGRAYLPALIPEGVSVDEIK
jgi:hypothetical protein